MGRDVTREKVVQTLAAITLILAIAAAAAGTHASAANTNIAPQQNIKPTLVLQSDVSTSQVKYLVIKYYASIYGKNTTEHIKKVILTYACPMKVGKNGGEIWVPCTSVTLTLSNATIIYTGFIEGHEFSWAMILTPTSKLPAGILYSVSIVHKIKEIGPLVIGLANSDNLSKMRFAISVMFSNDHTKKLANGEYLDTVKVFTSNIEHFSDTLPIVLPGKARANQTKGHADYIYFSLNICSNVASNAGSFSLEGRTAWVHPYITADTSKYFIIQRTIYIASGMKYYYSYWVVDHLSKHKHSNTSSKYREYAVFSSSDAIYCEHGALVPLTSSYSWATPLKPTYVIHPGFFKLVLVTPETAKVIYVRVVALPPGELALLKELRGLGGEAVSMARNLSVGLAAVNESVKSLEAVQGRLGARLTAVEGRLSNVSASVRRLGSALSSLVGRVESLSKAVNASLKKLGEGQATLKAVVGSIASQVSKLKSGLRALQAGLTDVKGLETKLSAKLGSLASEVATLRRGEGGVSAEVTSLAGKLKALEASVSGLQTRVSGLESKVSVLGGKLESLGRGLGNGLESLKAQVASNSAAIHRLSEGVGKLNTTQSRLAHEVSMVNAALGVGVAGLACGLVGIGLALRRRS